MVNTRASYRYTFPDGRTADVLVGRQFSFPSDLHNSSVSIHLT